MTHVPSGNFSTNPAWLLCERPGTQSHPLVAMFLRFPVPYRQCRSNATIAAHPRLGNQALTADADHERLVSYVPIATSEPAPQEGAQNLIRWTTTANSARVALGQCHPPRPHRQAALAKTAPRARPRVRHLLFYVSDGQLDVGMAAMECVDDASFEIRSQR